MVYFFYKSWHDSTTVAGTILQQPLAQLFTSHWQDCSTVTGTIVQQSPAQLFNSHWHNCSTVTGMIVQQSLAWLFNSLARLFNSHEQYFFFFLCWQNSSTLMFTVEESCYVPGIQHMILISQPLKSVDSILFIYLFITLFNVGTLK